MNAEDMEKNIELLAEIQEDISVPKNVKEKISQIISTLQQDQEFSIKIHKVMNDLDEVVEDTNLEPYTRTLIWNVASELEKLRK